MPTSPPPASRHLSPLAALASATFKQLIRDPALLLVAGAALVLIVFAPAYAVFHFGEMAKVMIDTGLSTALLAGLIIALLGPARAVAYELEDRTALTLLSKPVDRLTLVAGKYLGVMGAALAVIFPLAVAVLYVTRIAEAGEEDAAGPLLVRLVPVLAGGAVLAVLAALLFRRRRVLMAYLVLTAAAAAGVILTPFGDGWRLEVLAAAALIAMEVAVIAAAAMAGAVRLGAVGTLSAGLVVMILGHLRQLVGPGVGSGGFAGLLVAPVPGLEALNALEAAAAGAPIPAVYVAWAGVYATMYAAAALLVGAALLHGREVA